MACFTGINTGPTGGPFAGDTVARAAPGSGNTLQVARHGRGHSFGLAKAAQAARLVARDQWEKFTSAQKADWKNENYGTCYNRNNTHLATPNGWISFSRANFATAYFLGFADRLEPRLDMWTTDAYSIDGWKVSDGKFDFHFTPHRQSPVTPQPRLFIYANEPTHSGPPKCFRNTRLIEVYEGPFVDAVPIVRTLVFPWTLRWYHSITIVTRLATDAGYDQTRYIVANLP
jgi:hypothetical protein